MFEKCAKVDQTLKKNKSQKSKCSPEEIKKSKSVKLNHYLDINCDYLEQENVNDTLLNISSSFTIYQNNIRSLNKNFHAVEEIFQNCTDMPDIFAFSETQLHENSDTPYLEGYSFEYINSETKCGGVAMFISNNIDYSIR